MLSLVLPTYKESENLPELLPLLAKTLQGLPYEVIVVDDDSPDRTWEIARKLAEKDDHLRVLRRVGRRGLSSAVIEGWLAARGDVFAVMDADGQHDLTLLPKLYEAVKSKGGVAIGSRYVEGGSVGQWDERRHMMSKVATGMAIKLCKVPVKDPMSGFFALDRATFEKALPLLNPKGFKILLDLLIHVPRTTPVTELPFSFGLRTHGESKLSRQVQVEFLEYLYEAVFGRYISLTFVQYCIVGLLGVAVNSFVYWVSSRFLFEETAAAFSDISLAFLLGIEAAILFNFYLNNAWTFSQAKLKGWRAVTGFIRYNAACAIGALAAYSVAYFLLARGFGEVWSVVLGSGVSVIWNYTMSRLFTWKV